MGGDRRGVLEGLDRAVGLRPDYAHAHYNRGGLHFERRDWDAAIRDLARAAELDSDHAQARVYLGKALVEVGRAAAAIEALDAALELDRWPSPQGLPGPPASATSSSERAGSRARERATERVTPSRAGPVGTLAGRERPVPTRRRRPGPEPPCLRRGQRIGCPVRPGRAAAPVACCGRVRARGAPPSRAPPACDAGRAPSAPLRRGPVLARGPPRRGEGGDRGSPPGAVPVPLWARPLGPARVSGRVGGTPPERRRPTRGAPPTLPRASSPFGLARSGRQWEKGS